MLQMLVAWYHYSTCYHSASVLIVLSSADVIHAWALPVLGIKAVGYVAPHVVHTLSLC